MMIKNREFQSKRYYSEIGCFFMWLYTLLPMLFIPFLAQIWYPIFSHEMKFQPTVDISFTLIYLFLTYFLYNGSKYIIFSILKTIRPFYITKEGIIYDEGLLFNLFFGKEIIRWEDVESIDLNSRIDLFWIFNLTQPRQCILFQMKNNQTKWILTWKSYKNIKELRAYLRTNINTKDKIINDNIPDDSNFWT